MVSLSSSTSSCGGCGDPDAGKSPFPNVNGRLVLNVVIGSTQSPAAFDGTYALDGGRMEVKADSGVQWSVIEVP